MSRFVIEIVEGPEAGRQVDLTGELEVGRDPSAGLVLGDAQVSRRHARFRLAGDRVTIEDDGSRNGTYVNAQVVHGARRLSPGDSVRLGLTVLELRTAEQVAAEPSAVRPRPPITSLSGEVLRPVPEAELSAVAVQAPAGIPSFLAEEEEPAFIPRELVERAAGSRSGYDELAALVDARVKRQANVAAFAAVAVSALAVIVYFGAR